MIKHLGIEVPIQNVPELDPEFIPMGQFYRAYLAGASKPLDLAVERMDGQVAVWHTNVHGTPEMAEADVYCVERLVKSMLWMYGGFRIYIAGDNALTAEIARQYQDGGKRGFDADFMRTVYERPFTVTACEQVPKEHTVPKALGRHLDGCRIGFDAGGSDRKVSAVIDGKSVYSEEVVWFPKTTADPQYHYDGIAASLKAAAAHMPRVDAVGVSSAGIYINNQAMIASLFRKVPPELYAAKVRHIYDRVIRDTFGNIPYEVVNDGEVSALAGSMNLGKNNVLGIAMGTSQAVGFIDANGCVTGWLNEPSFIPVSASPNAPQDDWSGDIGVGSVYFSQNSVIRLAPAAGISLNESLSPAEKLKAVQKLMEEGSEAAASIYRTIGTYLGHTLPLYHGLYGFEYVQFQGRVLSGRGGDIILETAKAVLADEYPNVAHAINLSLPDEKSRRVGQAVAAASLPELQK